MPRWLSSLEKAFFLQGVLMLLSLPILLAWGFQLSWMSPIGNIVCAPCLAFTLFLSSLIFFSELMGIPNGFIIAVFEKTVSWWSAALSWGQPSFLITAPCPPISFLVLLFACSCFLIHYRPFLSSRWRTVILYVLLGVVVGGIKWAFTPSEHSCTVGGDAKQLTLQRKQGKTIVVDPGITSTPTALHSWIQYTVLTELRKKYGSEQIDYLIFLKPTRTTHVVAQELLVHSANTTIILPAWIVGPTPSIAMACSALKQWTAEHGHQVKELAVHESFADIVSAQDSVIMRSPRAQHIQLLTHT